MDAITYHIYARTEYAQPLTFTGAVTVTAGERPPLPAGENWVEVIAFPQDAVIQVIPRPDPPQETTAS